MDQATLRALLYDEPAAVRRRKSRAQAIARTGHTEVGARMDALADRRKTAPAGFSAPNAVSAETSGWHRATIKRTKLRRKARDIGHATIAVSYPIGGERMLHDVAYYAREYARGNITLEELRAIYKRISGA